ncbi:MAG: hypothetical protein SGARI_005804 [Bacillariaceae sp.]
MSTLMVQSTSKYRSMKDTTDLLSDFHTWDEDKLGIYFKRRGLGQYVEALKRHKITGQLAPLLTDDDLREIGVTVVGDRLMFKKYVKELSRKERANTRIESLWEGEERIFFSEVDKSLLTLAHTS